MDQETKNKPEKESYVPTSDIKDSFARNPTDNTVHPRFLISCITNKKRAESMVKRMEKHWVYSRENASPKIMPKQVKSIDKVREAEVSEYIEGKN